MTPFIGEIKLFGGNFAPLGWALCDGQLLSIAQNDALYSLLGTTYGGDGTTTFGLPDLRGRIPLHMDGNHPMGAALGTEQVTLSPNQLPAHSHTLQATSTEVEGVDPTGSLLGKASANLYGAPNPGKAVTMAAESIGQTGDNTPHDNMQPYLCVSYIIALEGVYPSRP